MGMTGSCVFVMLGGTGDLMRRKLLPALFYLADNKLLPERYAILGVARDPDLTDAQFRRWARNSLADAGLTGRKGTRNWCDACLHYQALDETSAADYQALAARIASIEQGSGIHGNQTLFVHADETEAAWRLYTPLLRKRSPLRFYPAGSWGPAAADRLVHLSGNAWANG